MIYQYKLNRLSENELYILGVIFKDLLIDKNRIGDASLPMHRLNWLQLEPTCQKIKQSEDLLHDKYKHYIKSIITKLIS